jgi:hypothetical protein
METKSNVDNRIKRDDPYNNPKHGLPFFFLGPVIQFEIIK